MSSDLTPSPFSTSNLRILHLSGRSDHGGGPEHILQVVAARLPGSEHFIGCPDDGVYWQRYVAELGADCLCALPHRRFSPWALWQLRAFARRNRIDIIHSHGTCAGTYSRILALTLGLPVVHSFHGVPITRSLKHSVYNLSERLLGRATHCGIAVSAGEADVVHARWRNYRGKLAVVPNGIDIAAAPPEWATWPITTPCHPAKISAPLDVHAALAVSNSHRPITDHFQRKAGKTLRTPSDMQGQRSAAAPTTAPASQQLRIVSFTRCNQQKHPELLVEIARVLHLLAVDFHIDAYGEGLPCPRLCDEAARRGVADRLHFHPPTDTPSAALAGAHIYLSTSRWEGMPLAVLEAWRAGLVVVASDAVGNRDLVSDGRTGRLFPVGDGRAAARIIRDLGHDDLAAARLRQRASRLARLGHCRNLMAMRLEWLYRHMAENRLHDELVTQTNWPADPEPIGMTSSARLLIVRA